MISEDNYSIPPCLCNKVNMISRMMNTYYRKALSSYKVSNEQVTILFVLKALKSCSQQQLANRLSIEKSTLSRNVTKLLDNGWISRKPGKNAKEKLLTLTPAGILKEAEIKPIWRDVQREATRMLGFSTIKELDRMIIELKKETENA